MLLGAKDILGRVAIVSPRQLLEKNSQGKRQLVGLFQECRAGGLLRAGATGADYDLDDIRRLHALFDVFLDNGLAALVVDFVSEVCHDAYAVSSDAYEARLMEPSLVREWCAATLVKVREGVVLEGQQARLAPLGQMVESGGLATQRARLAGVLPVIEALIASQASEAQPSLLDASLHASADSEQSTRAGDSELQAALHLQQCLQVAQWCVEQRLHQAPAFGRHASRPAWAKLCAERAAGMQGRVEGASPFLWDLCAQAAPPSPPTTEGGQQRMYPASVAGGLHSKYPFHSLEEALASLFLSGATHTRAFHAKLAVMLYYLQDAGHAVGSAQAGSPSPELHVAFRHGFRVLPTELDQWRAALLLDCAAADGKADKLDLACSLLKGSSSPATPFKFAWVLSKGFKRHNAAAGMLRSGVGASCTELEQATRAMDIRLSCGLVTEAFLEARRHCQQAKVDRAEQHLKALLRHLLSWTAEHKVLDQVTELPMGHIEEAVVVDWMQERVRAKEAAPALLPLYHLQRGRTPEALACCPPSVLHPPSSSGATSVAIAQLLAASARLLPLPARKLLVEGARSSDDDTLLPSMSTLRIWEGAAGVEDGQLSCVGTSDPLLLLAHPMAGVDSCGALSRGAASAKSETQGGKDVRVGGMGLLMPSPATSSFAPARRPTKGGFLFSKQVREQTSPPQAQAATEEEAQPASTAPMSTQEFTEMLGLPSQSKTTKKKGNQPVKRARVTRSIAK